MQTQTTDLREIIILEQYKSVHFATGHIENTCKVQIQCTC